MSLLYLVLDCELCFLGLCKGGCIRKHNFLTAAGTHPPEAHAAAALLLQGSRLGGRSKKIFPCQWKIHNRYRQRWEKETLLLWTGTTVLPSCTDEQLWHLGKETWVSLRPNPDLCEREGNSPWEILSPWAWCVLLRLRMMCRDPGTAFQGLLCKRNRIRKGRVPSWQHCQP